MLTALLRAVRPRQWVKNLFVAAPLIFGKALRDEPRLLRAAAATALFCLVSSAVYLWNDLLDVEKDRLHPRKRLRPIAAGTLPIPVARVAAAVLATLGLALGWALDPWFAAAAATYLTLNVAYSLRLKHVPYVDVLIIASGFLLRVMAGGVAIAVYASGWLLLCTGLGACFLGFGKRSHELATAGTGARKSLDGYDAKHLRIALWGTGLATLVAYLLYTLSAHTRVYFGTHHMVWTVPILALGMGRFVALTGSPRADSPTDEMLRDPVFLATLVSGAAAVVAIIYFTR